MQLKDSGNRREFESGAVRDINESKGRCDLLPLDVLGEVCDDTILTCINKYVRTGQKMFLVEAIKEFSTKQYGDLYTAMLEVSKHYEDGCVKYGDRNWKKRDSSPLLHRQRCPPLRQMVAEGRGRTA